LLTAATITVTVMTLTTAAAIAATAVAAAPTIAASTIAAMATMTSNGNIVRTHQSDSDDGEKHRHTQENDSIHFCIPPFDSLVGVDHKEAAVLASRLQRWRVQGGGADFSGPPFVFHYLQGFPVKLCRLAKI